MGKQRKPHIVVLVSETDRLQSRDWDVLEKLFAEHPGLAKIECPERLYPGME